MIDDEAGTLSEMEGLAVVEPPTSTTPPVRAARKASKKTARKAKKAERARKPKGGKGAGKAAVPSGVSRVKVGRQVFWVADAVARALTAKDRKKLKAVLKRAQKRAKAAD